MHLNGENRKMPFNGRNLARNEQMVRKCMFMKNFGPSGLSTPAPGLYTCI